MKKTYLKPEVEVISLITTEKITADGDEIIDGDMGTASSIW